MAAYLPLLKKVAEALVYGLVVSYGAYEAGGLNSALVAGFGAVVGKLLPPNTVTKP